MLFGKVLNEYLSALRLSSNICNGYSIDFQTASIVIVTHYLSCNIILLLTGTTGIVNNRNILTDWQDEIKHLDRN